VNRPDNAAALDRLTRIQRDLAHLGGSFAGLFTENRLRGLVHEALAVPEIVGASGGLAGYGTRFGAAARAADQVAVRAGALANEQLPAVWLGVSAVAAGQAVTALADDLARVAGVLDRAGTALCRYQVTLDQSRVRDRAGRDELAGALRVLDEITHTPLAFDADLAHVAQQAALAGVATRVAGFRAVTDAARTAGRELDEVAALHRAGRLTTSTLTAADKLIVTDAAAPPAATDLTDPTGAAATSDLTDPTGAAAASDLADANLILTADAAGRASERLDRLSVADRARLDGLLAGSVSAQERAYLLQALGAGHTVAEIAAFDRLIHTHAADPAWLRDRLDPAPTRLDPSQRHQPAATSYDGNPWTQGARPTCVAASTVMARAKVDPVYALQLTTGGHPGDPEHDNGTAFTQRFNDEQTRVYGEGRSLADRLFDRDGIGDGGKDDVADDELGAPTGRSYALKDLNSAADRTAVLPAIERSVDQGVPVPFGVRDHHGAHELLVIGHDRGALQVYNPWGYTMWVTEDDFVGGRLGVLGSGVPPTPDDVTLAR
jgi:hypothetical protein